MKLRLPYKLAMKLLKNKMAVHKQQLAESGIPEKTLAWVDEKPVIDERSTFWPRGEGEKEGSISFPSRCPYYKGYYIGGHLGAVECSLVDNPLPGAVYTLQCQSDCYNCPVMKNKDLAIRQAEEDIVNKNLC